MMAQHLEFRGKSLTSLCPGIMVLREGSASFGGVGLPGEQEAVCRGQCQHRGGRGIRRRDGEGTNA